MNTEKQNSEFEKDLDRNNPNYIHNLFMRNADIWTDEHDWLMSIEIFKQVAEVLQSPIISSHEPIRDEELEKKFSLSMVNNKYKTPLAKNDVMIMMVHIPEAAKSCVEIAKSYAQSQQNNREANISLDKAIKILYENSEIETSKNYGIVHSFTNDALVSAVKQILSLATTSKTT